MEKNEILLELRDLSKSTIDWEIQSYNEDEINIGITAHEGSLEGKEIEAYIAEMFEAELEDELGLIDETEGFMSYMGDMPIIQLEAELNRLGFKTIITL